MIASLPYRSAAAPRPSRVAIGRWPNGTPRTYRLARPGPRRWRLWAVLRRTLP